MTTETTKSKKTTGWTTRYDFRKDRFGQTGWRLYFNGKPTDNLYFTEAAARVAITEATAKGFTS